jgi:hypothetical protein
MLKLAKTACLLRGLWMVVPLAVNARLDEKYYTQEAKAYAGSGYKAEGFE